MFTNLNDFRMTITKLLAGIFNQMIGFSNNGTPVYSGIKIWFTLVGCCCTSFYWDHFYSVQVLAYSSSLCIPTIYVKTPIEHIMHILLLIIQCLRTLLWNMLWYCVLIIWLVVWIFNSFCFFMMVFLLCVFSIGFIVIV